MWMNVYKARRSFISAFSLMLSTHRVIPIRRFLVQWNSKECWSTLKEEMGLSPPHLPGNTAHPQCWGLRDAPGTHPSPLETRRVSSFLPKF